MTKPVLALCVGDPSGIGPEIALRLLLEAERLPARLLLLGSEDALRRDAALVPGAVVPPRVDGPEAFTASDLAVALFEPGPPLRPLPPVGVVDPRAGAASHAWVLAGARLALEGRVAGLVTGPISKGAWRKAGVTSPGHTEALCDLAGVPRVLMLLVGARLRVALATIHVPLRDVPSLLDMGALTEGLVLLASDLRRFGVAERPRIAVAGLNPHAGEGGLFGREENDVIEPAVEAARGRGVDAWGPLPADACIPAAAAGSYDAVLAMYHDQALPAVKALAPRRAVNVTLGLPFLRTSVDHGTAFDVAGRGVATASSLEEAVRLASLWTRNRAIAAQS